MTSRVFTVWRYRLSSNFSSLSLSLSLSLSCSFACSTDALIKADALRTFSFISSRLNGHLLRREAPRRPKSMPADVRHMASRRRRNLPGLSRSDVEIAG